MRRPAFLAGSWYPRGRDDCRATILEHGASAPAVRGGPWRALVGPHAGFVYSGKAAAHGYAWLASGLERPDLCVVFGSHRGPNGPNTIYRGEAWETPLGDLSTARDLAEELHAKDYLGLEDEPAQPRHPDNGVELHLPLVKHFFPHARLLMLGVAASEDALAIGAAVGEAVRAHGREAVFIGSTDLTHYGPNYAFEPRGSGAAAVRWAREENDRGFIDRLLAADEKGALSHGVDCSSACCPGAAAAALVAARAYGHGPNPALAAHYLSCDVRPSPSFVGYASVLW